MRKIKTALPSSSLVIRRCCEGIVKDVDLKSRLTDATVDFHNLEQQYRNLGTLQELYTLKKYLKNNSTDPLVTSKLLHSELTKIYSNFYAYLDKPARKIYDEIKANALGECPYCGIGNPEHLDHYLPKKYYPQFSITSLNLVPACLDCNVGSKGSDYAAEQGNQIIHPYLDADFYFDQQWIYAEFLDRGDDYIVVEYSVKPPIDWQPIQKERVNTHFMSFNLKNRFSRLAADELSILLEQIKTMEEMGMSSDTTCEVLVNPVINSNLPANNWRKVMHVAAKKYINNK